MPKYKKRQIDLNPFCQTDGTWQCSYTILEFGQSCWGCQEGHVDGTFSSRREAKSAAWREAKQIIDKFEIGAAPSASKTIAQRDPLKRKP
ncbi:MAG: hypothetical protein H8K04_07055 [Nitrospira sp.]